MIESLPIKAVVSAVDAERRMVQEDLDRTRTPETEDIRSVLNFCEFVAAVVQGVESPASHVPAEHLGFYREMVRKLVAARQLPVDAGEQIDRAFTESFFKSLTLDS